MGWAYDDWRGPFYSRSVAAGRMLTEYAEVFDCIELDTTFYAVPRASVLDSWARQVPDHFRFSAKVPRLVTHERRLVGPAALTEARDFGRLLWERLGEKLGTLLLQLPPEFGLNDRRFLESFADAIADPDLPWVVELRSSTWETTDIATTLGERGIGVAATDRVFLPGGALRYIRLLGEENSVESFAACIIDQSAGLDLWSERLRSAPKGDEIAVHVRNFYEGHAPGTLVRLRERLGLSTPTPPGQQQMSLF